MLLEHHGKAILQSVGITVPLHIVAETADEAYEAALQVGPKVVVKALVPAGGRGKAGGVLLVDDADAARGAAAQLLGSELGHHRVDAVLIEEQVSIADERYVAVAIDPASGRPTLMQSAMGGVEVESMADQMTSTVLDDQQTPPRPEAADSIEGVAAAVVDAFFGFEATLIEINPLAVTTDGSLVALDAKVELDESANHRRDRGNDWIVGDAKTDREKAAAELGLRLIELGGDVAILANGAGLTMATVDAVANVGGQPANFLEIGGDAYTKATPALELVLSLPDVRCLLVNFCGAFARCDVMVAGVIEAWETLRPTIPVHFSISGTGSTEARQMVVERLSLQPHPSMEAAVRAAVNETRPDSAAGGGRP